MVSSLSSCSDSGIFSLSVDPSLNLFICVSPISLLIAIFVVVSVLFFRLFFSGAFSSEIFEIESGDIGLGPGTIKFKPNLDDRAIAYKIWIELSTRKIGLPIDERNDVISEIYDSWYAFFQITRDLLKEVPVSKVRNDSTQKIIQLSINILNDGIRPHLTNWQARFRRWYDAELSLPENIGKHPQDVQRQFPNYSELNADMLSVNASLMIYRERMKSLVMKSV